MRTFFTALAFLIILWAVIPALRRSLHVSSNTKDTHESL